jgi:hypothetical protein
MIAEAVAGVAGYVVNRLLVRFAGPVVPDAEGWRHLGAGVASLFFLILGAGLTSAVVYAHFFVGPARADAESQMLILPVLIVAFGLYSLCIAYFTFARAVRWKGDVVSWRSLTGRDGAHRLDEVAGVTRSDLLGTYRIRFADDTVLHFSALLRGAAELVALIDARRPDLR